MEHSAILLTIGRENQFSVFLRLAVLHRFYGMIILFNLLDTLHNRILT